MTELGEDSAQIVAESFHNGAVKVIKNVFGRTGVMGGFEYARLRLEHPDAKVLERRFDRLTLFVAIPSARGIYPDTMWNVDQMRTALEAAGHLRDGGSVYRMPLDVARNELHMLYMLKASCDQALLMDDDVQIVPPAWIVKMVEAVATGEVDVISAPCRMRHHGGEGAAGLFNILPMAGDTVHVGDLRLLELVWTGLGAVLCSKRVMKALYESNEKYASSLLGDQGIKTAAIYGSQVVPGRTYQADCPEELNVYVLDDKVFSLKVRALGFKIHAAIDVPTVHAGMHGCFAEDLEALSRAREMQANAKAPSLLGPDGRPAR